MFSYGLGEILRCQPGHFAEFYVNSVKKYSSSQGAVYNDPDVVPTLNQVIGVSCCREARSTAPFGLLYSATGKKHVLVSDYDWKCKLATSAVLRDAFSTFLDDSSWLEAYVIESNSRDDNGHLSYFDYDSRFEPYSKWIWARDESGKIPSLESNSTMLCAFCRANAATKYATAMRGNESNTCLAVHLHVFVMSIYV